MTDAELLQQHTQGSKDAFREIVRRHIDWVWSAAKRRVGDSHLAEDVTQSVFIVLSRKHPRLKPDQSLIPWLFGVVSLTARQALRSEFRRRRRETEAASMRSELDQSQKELCESLAADLDDLVAKLRYADRQAILLRYYGQMTLTEVGAALRISEAAAQKRVARATEKLRDMLAGRGIMMPAATLTGWFLTGVIEPAPPALAATIVAVPATATTAGTVSLLTKGVIIMTGWTKLKLAAGVALAILLTIGTGVIVLRPRTEPIETVNGWTAKSLVDALDVRAAQLVSGNLSFIAFDHANGAIRQMAEYPFLFDGRRFATTFPDGAKVVFDGTHYMVRDDKLAEFVIRDGVRKDFMHSEVDPRYFNHLEPTIARYFRSNISRTRIEQSPESKDMLILSIEVPKQELGQAMISWPDACREGALIRVWVQTTEATLQMKMELLGTTGRYKDVLGRRVTWSEWTKRDPGVWIPASIGHQVFVTRSGAPAPVYVFEYRFDRVDLTYQPIDADFELSPPAGYRVHDSRNGKRTVYVAQETANFSTPESPR